jgi:hypothetical protein
MIIKAKEGGQRYEQNRTEMDKRQKIPFLRCLWERGGFTVSPLDSECFRWENRVFKHSGGMCNMPSKTTQPRR